MAEWLAMGGYAFFVWSSYGIFAVTMVYLLVSALIKLRAAKSTVQRQRHRVGDREMNQ